MNSSIISQKKFWLFLLCASNSLLLSAQVVSPSLYTDSKYDVAFGAGLTTSATSNVYSINDLVNGNITNPELKSNKLFASGIGRANLHLSYSDCQLGMEKSYLATASSNPDALVIYNSVNSQGLNVPQGSHFSPSISSTALTGVGFEGGCVISNKSGLRLGGSIHALSLNSFTQRSYQGTVSSGPNGALTVLNENWVSMTPQVPELQTSSSVGQSYSFDLDIGYRNFTSPIFGDLLIYNFFNSVSLNNSPYLNRNLNATFPTGSIIQNGTIPPLTGRYGNQDATLKVPRIWSTDIGYQISKTADLGIKLNGLDRYYQTMLFTTLRCSTCSSGNGYTAMIDSNFTTLGLGYSSKNWGIYLGTLLNHTFGFNSLNQINLNVRY